MVPQPNMRDGRFKNDHLIDTPMESSVLVLGDSFCRIYQSSEPASLGEITKSAPAEEPDTAESLAETGGETGNDGEVVQRREKAAARFGRFSVPVGERVEVARGLRHQ